MVLRDKKNPEECQLNVDNDPEVQATKVWINCLVHSGDKIIGIIGTGIDLTEFIQTAVKADQAGVTKIFVDGDGSIQAHFNLEMIYFHTLVNDPEEKKTIYCMVDDDVGRDKLRAMIKRLKTGPKHVETGFLNIQGKRTMVGAAALSQIGWFAVTVMDPKAQELGRHFVPIALLMAGATVLTLVVIAVLLNRTVLNRIARLEKNVKNVRDGNYAFDTLDAGSDEIGLLNASFWKWPIKSASTHKN